MNFGANYLKEKLIDQPWTNIATVLFGLLCLGDWIFGFHLAGDTEVVLNLAVAFAFMNSLHVLFPFWMMQRSDDYRQLIELNLAKRSHVQQGVAVVFVVLFAITLSIYFLMSPAAPVAFNLFFVIWSTWHYLSQTRGLYSTTFLDGSKPKSYRRELFLLKALVFLLFSARAVRLYNLTYPGDFFAYLASLSTVLYVLSALTFCLLLAFVWLNFREKNKVQTWILARFLFWLGTAVTPASAYAVTAVHGSEYFDLTRRVERKSKKLTLSRRFLQGFVAVLIGYILLDTLLLGRYLSGWPTLQTSVICLGFSMTMTHYLLDTYIYRTKNEKCRLIMSRFSEGAELTEA